MEKLSDEATVLLAIVEELPQTTPEKVRSAAERLSKTNEIKYGGPKPDFQNRDVFGSAWNELIQKGAVRQVGSTKDNSPLFKSNRDGEAFKELYEEDLLTELQSFTGAISK